jgi:hypothetical protein
MEADGCPEMLEALRGFVARICRISPDELNRLPRDHRAGTLGNAPGMPALRSALSKNKPSAETRCSARRSSLEQSATIQLATMLF